MPFKKIKEGGTERLPMRQQATRDQHTLKLTTTLTSSTLGLQ